MLTNKTARTAKIILGYIWILSIRCAAVTATSHVGPEANIVQKFSESHAEEISSTSWTGFTSNNRSYREEYGDDNNVEKKLDQDDEKQEKEKREDKEMDQELEMEQHESTEIEQEEDEDDDAMDWYEYDEDEQDFFFIWDSLECTRIIQENPYPKLPTQQTWETLRALYRKIMGPNSTIAERDDVAVYQMPTRIDYIPGNRHQSGYSPGSTGV